MDYFYLVLIVILFYYTMYCSSGGNGIANEYFRPMFNYLTGANSRLYYMIETISSILLSAGIPWSISGEALVSAVTRGRLSRGDVNAVIVYPAAFTRKLLDLSAEFPRFGLSLNDLPDGTFQLTSSIPSTITSDTIIHMIPLELVGDRWMSTSKVIGYDEWYMKGELFPTRPYYLGSLKVPGPNNPLPYIHRNMWFAKEKKRGPLLQKQVLLVGTQPVVDVGPARQVVLLGNKTPLVIPKVGVWRKYLWGR